MPFTPLETVSIIECLENFVEALRPKDESIRKKLDYGYKVEGYSVFITEIRPRWNSPEIIKKIDDFVNVVGEDAHHCFFG